MKASELIEMLPQATSEEVLVRHVLVALMRHVLRSGDNAIEIDLSQDELQKFFAQSVDS